MTDNQELSPELQRLIDAAEKAERIKQQISKPKEIVVGMTMDEVLEIKPRNMMTKDPEIIKEVGEGANKMLTVRWHYSDVILTLEIATSEDGKTTTYAVQNIERISK